MIKLRAWIPLYPPLLKRSYSRNIRFSRVEGGEEMMKGRGRGVWIAIANGGVGGDQIGV